MTIHVLVEGASELVLLEQWAPRVLRTDRVKIHPHQGKGRLPANLHSKPESRSRGLLDQLPAKQRVFARSPNRETDRVIVLVDADDDDTSHLTEQIEFAARKLSPELPVIVRLAVWRAHKPNVWAS